MISIKSIGRSSKATGTSLSGYLNVPYSKLVELFGKPDVPTDGYKTDAEWHLLIKERGEETGFVTVYNFKDGKNYCGANGLNVEDISDWHVGSRNMSEYYDVQDYVQSRGQQEFDYEG